jgi:hypothetical protein
MVSPEAGRTECYQADKHHGNLLPLFSFGDANALPDGNTRTLPAILTRHLMGLFDKIFKKASSEKIESKKNLSDSEIEQRNHEFKVRFEKAKDLLTYSLENYNAHFCQCAYPRFQQIIAIDCTNTGDSYKCYDTDLLIDLSAKYFDIEDSKLSDECKNEKWICKKCHSIYEYGWSDFSIYVERQKLKLTDLKLQAKGKPTVNPIPLYLGLMGHSYPPNTEMSSVDFKEFQNYMTER